MSLLSFAPCAGAVLLCLPLSAHAGSVNFGAAFVQDLGDAGVEEKTKLGPGFGLQTGLRFPLLGGEESGPRVALRVAGRFDFAMGGGDAPPDIEQVNPDTGEVEIVRPSALCRELDRISWTGDGVRRADYVRCGWMLAGGLSVGPELYLPVRGAILPYFGARLGVVAIGNFHDVGSEHQYLMDPDANDFRNSNNIDPYSVRWSPLVDLTVGVLTGEDGPWYVELGYSTAWVGPAQLQKSVAGLEVQREPYAWNALRVAGGFVFGF
ncbi:MAG: hypothetical protein KTR31_38355 [Myxococcales bacterium]|nr:hypothetical protein [Myxococcales bacterium]